MNQGKNYNRMGSENSKMSTKEGERNKAFQEN
jgi:hypothetical protein